MATYLPGVTDYIPQIQPFVPDYNFYSGALDFKQGKHDAARKQLSTLYGSLLNAPLTRDDNTAAREQFFKIIEQDIQKIAGTDLSLSQNTEAAAGIFNQLLDNKYIVKDMVWTKNFQRELQRAEGFKNCTDPDKCGGSWWEGGERLLQYDREDFRNASKEQSLNMGMSSFVPYQDVMKKAIKLAKDADLNVTLDQNTGQWITTTKNGPLIIKPLQNLFTGSFANDPAISEYYEANAKLQRRDFMYSNKEKYGSLEAAEQVYINQYAPLLETLLNGKDTELEDDVKVADAKVKKIDEAIVKKPEGERTKLQELRDEFNDQSMAYSRSYEYAKDIAGEKEVAYYNKGYTGYQIDRFLASATLGQDIDNAAQTMAYRNFEQTMRVNPYALENVQFKNRLLFEEVQHRNAIALEQIKKELDTDGTTNQYLQSFDMFGQPEANIPKPVTNILGNFSVVEGDKNSYPVQQKFYNQFSKERGEIKNQMSANEYEISEQVLRTTKEAADKGDVQAKEDYIALVGYMINANVEPDITQIGYDDSRILRNVEALENVKYTHNNNKAKYYDSSIKNAKTLDEKYDIAKRQTVGLDSLEGYQIDTLYNKTIDYMINPDTAGNEVLREHLAPIWAETEPLRRDVIAKNLALQNLDSWYKTEIDEVTARINNDSNYGKIWYDAFKSYFDDHGHIVNEASFIKNMVSRGYTNYDTLRNMYSADDSDGYGVHDMWKKAFSTYGTPNGDLAWLAVKGGGNYYGQGSLYDNVDVKNPASIGVQGSLSYLQEAFSTGAIFTKGTFTKELPENDDEAELIAKTLYTDMLKGGKDKDRPLLSVTYTDIAVSDENTIGLNIKINEDYRKRYAGTKDEPGLMSDQKLVTEGFTIYMDKADAQNLFRQGAKITSSEMIMRYKGEIALNAYPHEVRDFKIKAMPNKTYEASGEVLTGITDGKYEWTTHKATYYQGEDVNQLIANYEALIATWANEAQMIKKQYSSTSKN